MIVDNAEYRFGQEGCCYVVELAGCNTLVFKIGETGLSSLRARLAPASTFAPEGIQVHRLEMFPDRKAAERRIHRALARYRRSQRMSGQGTEFFETTLRIINRAFDEELALQKQFFMQQYKMLGRLKAKGFFEEETASELNMLLQAKVTRQKTLGDAIMQAINSTVFDAKTLEALSLHGVEIDRRKKVAKILCARTLVKLVGVEFAQPAMSALQRVSHFNGLGKPVFF